MDFAEATMKAVGKWFDCFTGVDVVPQRLAWDRYLWQMKLAGYFLIAGWKTKVDPNQTFGNFW